MGTLAHFNLAGIRVLHGLRSFVETGTAQGAGVELARVAGFQDIHSIEVVPDIADAAKARFRMYPHITVWEGDSKKCLSLILKEMSPDPALFWLDAHLPGSFHGSDFGISDPDVMFPLEEELRLIKEARGQIKDVLLIDDMRLYVPGPYSEGDIPDDWEPLKKLKRSANRLDFVREMYSATHGVVGNYADHGYLMVFPKILLKSSSSWGAQ